MTTTQTSSDLLLSLSSQIRDAQTSTEVSDLYLLARGVFYSEVDLLLEGGLAALSPSNAKKLVELRKVWTELLAMTDDAMKNVTFEQKVNAGLVTFSDGSSYGGRK